MKNNILTIAKKELARFFSNKASALVSILLPGLMIFAMWSFMGSALSDMFSHDADSAQTIEVVNLPDSVAELAKQSDIEIVSVDSLPSSDEMRSLIKAGTAIAFVEFPQNFDALIATYETSSGQQAPQVSIFYDTTNTSSQAMYSLLVSLLDQYESSLANRFDVNTGSAVYNVAETRDMTAMFIVSLVPMLLMIFLFTGCMSVTAESIAGEKERGTMATMLATPIKRSDIALGKVLALSLIGLLIAASSTIGVFAGLPNLAQGSVDLSIYGVPEYSLLALVILSTTLVIVMLMTIVSSFAKTTKEASLYLTPLMMLGIVIGLLGMFGDGAQTNWEYYLIPLYNSVQCMIGIFTFDFQPTNVVICVVSNLVYTGIGIFVLQKLINSERLMFAR